MAPAKPPPAKNNEKRRPGTTIVKKSKQATASRNSRRLQRKSPEFVEAQPKPVQASQSSSTSSASILPPVSPPKRLLETLAPRPTSHKKELPRNAEAGVIADDSESPPKLPQELPLLSDEKVEALQSVFTQVMTTKPVESTKRTLRSRPLTGTKTSPTQSYPRNNGNATYRHMTLTAFGIRLHSEPPGDIETTIKGIVNAKISENPPS
ncbi:hypothetical protein QQX98_006657 [Neonectria punicea]|uniref:Uncharacterized protein n=1 Tax=Neonectria punicea TaxID=979145 RepID=A0ABR1H0A0_9HYPO